MPLVLIKFLRGFFATLITFYARRLVYYIDDFFNDSLNQTDVECQKCQSLFSSKVLNNMNKSTCLTCGAELNFKKEEYTFDDRRSQFEYRK